MFVKYYVTITKAAKCFDLIFAGIKYFQNFSYSISKKLQFGRQFRSS